MMGRILDWLRRVFAWICRIPHWLRHDSAHWLAVRKLKFDEAIDKERVSDYQKFYYPMIFIGGVYLAFAADDPTQALADTLGPVAFDGWLGLHLVCPWMTLLGRRIYAQAGRAAPGEPNGAYGAAWMQLSGDGGIWGAILVYVGCIFNTFYWGQALYPSFYLLMGVPGGFLFTYRSLRRLRQINRRAKRIEDHE